MAETSKRDSMEATVDEIASKTKDIQLEQPKPIKKRLGLADLPSSVRNSIYKYALDTELVNVGKPNVSYSHSIKDGVLQFRASRSPFPVDTALFYLNKEISTEAINYFYSKNLFIRLSLYTPDARHAKTMLEDSGLLFSVADPMNVDKAKQHAMDLTIVEKNSSQKRACVIFPAQYLPRLINFLDQASRTTASWAPSHTLSMHVLNTYAFPIAKLQGDLLELFRLLNNLGRVDVNAANLLPGYAESLQDSMRAASFSADTWLATVTAMADRADEAREKRNWEFGHQNSQSAIIALTYGYLTRAELLHSQSEDFTKAIQRLRWRCDVGIGKALYKKYQSYTTAPDWMTSPSIPVTTRQEIANAMLLAETHTSYGLSIATDSPSPNSNPWFQTLPAELIPPNKAEWFSDEERALAWYACGIVHLALGEYLFAAGDLERANALGSGKNFQEAFQKARDSIDWDVKPGMGLRKAAKVAKGLTG